MTKKLFCISAEVSHYGSFYDEDSWTASSAIRATAEEEVNNLPQRILEATLCDEDGIVISDISVSEVAYTNDHIYDVEDLKRCECASDVYKL